MDLLALFERIDDPETYAHLTIGGLPATATEIALFGSMTEHELADIIKFGDLDLEQRDRSIAALAELCEMVDPLWRGVGDNRTVFELIGCLPDEDQQRALDLIEAGDFYGIEAD